MKSMLVRLIFLAAMIPLCALAQEKERMWIPGSEAKIGPWELLAWKEKDGGRSGCSMESGYKSGVDMYFLLEGDQWRIGWWHSNWRYADGQTISVAFWIDGSPQQTVNAERVGGSKTPWLRAVLPDSPELFDQFRAGNKLHIRVQGGVSHSFNLTATSAALTALRSCAARFRGTEPPPPSTASGPSGDSPVYALPALTPDQRIDAVRLAANLLTRMPRFRILDEAEQKERDKAIARLQAAVVWRSDGVIGLLHLFPDETEEKILKLASFLIAGTIQQCKERATVTTQPDVRSPAVRRVHSTCTEGTSQTTIRMILMPAGKSGVYMFLTEGKQESEAAVASADQLLRDALFEVVKK